MKRLTSTVAPLVLAGAGMMIAYAGLSLRINQLWQHDRRYVAVALYLGLAYILYFYLYQYYRNRPDHELDIRLIILGCAMFSLVLLLTVPLVQTDFYHYFFEDVAWHDYGQNPYFVTPQLLPTDPSSVVSGWQELPSQHGPMRAWLLLPAVALSRGNLVAGIFLYKGEFLLFTIGCALMLWQIAQRLGLTQPRLATLLLAWNPAVLYETQLSGGTDIMVAFWILLAVWLLITHRPYWSIFSLMVSVLIKYVSILVLPFWLLYLWRQAPDRRQRIFLLIKSTIVITIITVVSWLPFWRGVSTLDGVAWVAAHFESNSVVGLIALLVSLAYPAITVTAVAKFFEALFIISYAVVLVYAAWRGITSVEEVVWYSMITMALFLLLSKVWFYVKYLLWLFPLLFLSAKQYWPWGVGLSGLIVISAIYPDLFIIVAIPPLLLFAAHAFFRDQIRITTSV